MRYMVMVLSLISALTISLSPISSQAALQHKDKDTASVAVEESPTLETEIIDFLKAFSAAYKKGNIDEYMAFYSTVAVENGLNSLEKIKSNYVSDTVKNTITSHEFEIYEIKNLGRYSMIDSAYSKTSVNKSNGDNSNISGDVRIKIVRDQGFKIETIDYDRYIKNEYVLGPEDSIEISVWKSPDLSTAMIVRPDGMISLPLIGEIKAKGRTAKELKEVIEQKLGEYKQDPVVSVIVREANSQAIYIMGEITRPGKYLLRSETRILQAISLAGGFTIGANKDNIIILRKSFTNPEGKRIRVRYSDIISGKSPEANILIRSGDTIVLQPY